MKETTKAIVVYYFSQILLLGAAGFFFHRASWLVVVPLVLSALLRTGAVNDTRVCDDGSMIHIGPFWAITSRSAKAVKTGWLPKQPHEKY